MNNDENIILGTYKISNYMYDLYVFLIQYRNTFFQFNVEMNKNTVEDIELIRVKNLQEKQQSYANHRVHMSTIMHVWDEELFVHMKRILDEDDIDYLDYETFKEVGDREYV